MKTDIFFSHGLSYYYSQLHYDFLKTEKRLHFEKESLTRFISSKIPVVQEGMGRGFPKVTPL